MTEIPITAERMHSRSRAKALPRHFGTQLLVVERTVIRTLEKLVADYRGAYWHFYELSNGGFYMAPDLPPLRVIVPDNGFSDVLSADAAGIIACLFTYSRLASACSSEVFAEHYHSLGDFTRNHDEAIKILRATD